MTYLLIDLTDNQCRYPIHTEGNHHTFCGDPQHPSSQYCAEHRALTTLPADKIKYTTFWADGVKWAL